MAQLEQRLRDSELQVHSAMVGRGAPYTDVCLLRLQVRDNQGSISHLRGHLLTLHILHSYLPCILLIELKENRAVPC